MFFYNIILKWGKEISLNNKIAETRLKRFMEEGKPLVRKRMFQAILLAIFLNGLFVLGNQEASGYIEKANIFVELIRVIAFGIGTHGGNIFATAFLAVMLFGLWYFFKLKILFTAQIIDEENNLILADEGTEGTAHDMTEQEFPRYFKRTPIEESVDYTLGTDFNVKAEFKNSGIEDTTEIDHVVEILPKEEKGKTGPHKAIFGPSGSGKTFSFVFPEITNAIEKGKSLIITDPKGEIYEETHVFAQERGAHVRMLNLQAPIVSDGVNFVSMIGKDESMALTISSILIENSDGDVQTKRDFWTNGGLALTAFGLLYVAMNKDMPVEQKTLSQVYKLLTEPGDEDKAAIETDSNGNPINNAQKNSAVFNKLERLVAGLPATHPAKKQWNLFMAAPPNARDSVFMDVGTRLNVLNDSVLANIMSHNDIDLELPMKEQCVYYVVTDTESSRYDAIASMFFSLAFYRLCKYAKKHAKRVPVDFFLDEFPSIGTIPNFVKLISLVRSNNIEISIVAQDIGQLIEKYPGHAWESILSNCDTQIVLGVNDHHTNGTYWSDKTGKTTVYATKRNRSAAQIGGLNQQTGSESEGATGRNLYTVDEIMRMKGHGRQGVLIFTAYAPVKLLRKVGFHCYPAGKLILGNPDKYLYEKTPWHHRPAWWDDIEEQKKADIHHRKDFDWFDGMIEELEEINADYEVTWKEKQEEEKNKKLRKKQEEEARRQIEENRAKTLEEIFEKKKSDAINSVKSKVNDTFKLDSEKEDEKLFDVDKKKAELKDKALDFIYKVLHEERPETQNKEELQKIVNEQIKSAMDENGFVNSEVTDEIMTEKEIDEVWSISAEQQRSANEFLMEADEEEKDFIEKSKASRGEPEINPDDIDMSDPFANFM